MAFHGLLWLTRAQVLRYGAGDHYHYHLDNGGGSAISGRVLTALVYLNDNFEGGETNWPMSGTPPEEVNFRHVYRVREHFGNCQVGAGAQRASRPLRGRSRAAVGTTHLTPRASARSLAVRR